MLVTPRMWGIQQRIDFLEGLRLGNPNDYMLTFELEELRIKFDKLSRIERFGLHLVKGGKQTSISSTDNKLQGA